MNWLKSLSGGQKALLGVGFAGLAYLGYRYYENKKAASTESSLTAATSAQAAGGPGGPGGTGTGGGGPGGPGGSIVPPTSTPTSQPPGTASNPNPLNLPYVDQQGTKYYKTGWVTNKKYIGHPPVGQTAYFNIGGKMNPSPSKIQLATLPANTGVFVKNPSGVASTYEEAGPIP
jgi:hypothetical protein